MIRSQQDRSITHPNADPFQQGTAQFSRVVDRRLIRAVRVKPGANQQAINHKSSAIIRRAFLTPVALVCQ
jgi:hypothetical protein